MQSSINTTCNYDNKMSSLRASLADYRCNIDETNNQKHKIIIMNYYFFFFFNTNQSVHLKSKTLKGD